MDFPLEYIFKKSMILEGFFKYIFKDPLRGRKIFKKSRILKGPLKNISKNPLS